MEFITISTTGNRNFWEVIKEKIGFGLKASQSQLDAMVIALSNKADAIQADWAELTLISGVTFDAGAKPEYFKDAFGVVHLRGIAYADAANSRNIGTLPVGCRPSKMAYFATISDVGVSPVKVTVTPDGVVSILYHTSPGVNTRLEGVSFRAEQ